MEEAASRGPDYLAEALISRHNRRMTGLKDVKPSYLTKIREALVGVLPIDHMLRDLGAPEDRYPVDYGSSWPVQIGWGADSMVQVARLLMAGQVPGAAMLARTQLERWTINLAHNLRLEQAPGESTTDFIGRAWGVEAQFKADGLVSPDGVLIKAAAFGGARRAGDPEEDLESGELDGEDSPVPPTSPSHYPPTRLTDGTLVYPAWVYAWLSELLHGRGDALDTVRWESCRLLAGTPESAPQTASNFADLISLVLLRLYSCAKSAQLESESGPSTKKYRPYKLPDRIPAGEDAIPSYALWPLVPRTGLSPGVVANLASAAESYREVLKGGRPAGRLLQDHEMVDLICLERRHRAVSLALSALDAERKMLGAEFDADKVHGREGNYVFPAEMAALLSQWVGPGSLADSAAVASSALRSAYWLWLEDDDRAMAVLRVVVEQAARIRTWTRKPEKAAKLELSPTTTPRDWLEAAGWVRLNALNRALGEWSHVRIGSRWSGARSLIVALQPDVKHPERAELTGRGFALDAVSLLLGVEIAEALKGASPGVAAAFKAIMDERTERGAEADLEAWLNHVLLHRATSLGEPDFAVPAAGETDNPGGNGATFN